MEWHDANGSDIPMLYEPVWLFHRTGTIGGSDAIMGAVSLAVLTRVGTWVSVTAEAPQVEYHAPLAWALVEKPPCPQRVPARWEGT